MQFSNGPVPRSALSGNPITNFRTFEGSGIRHSIAVTTGLFWRF